MKNIFWICTGMLLCSSCQKFLTENPKGNLSADQFFNTKEECLTAVNGVYFSIFDNAETTHSVNLMGTLMYGTDEVFTPAPVPSGGMVHATYNVVQSDSRLLDYWTIFYRGIRNANLTISRIEKSPVDANSKNEFIGEVKFLRSYMYYYLVTMWGDVPYWTDEVVVEEVSKIGKTPANDIFDSVLTDLNDAEAVLPAITYGQNKGRATKWAAKMLKARIYLWQKDWTNAEKEAQEIIDNSPHRLLPNFGDIFRATNELNDEIIWGVQFQKDLRNNLQLPKFRPSTKYEKQVPNPGWFDGSTVYCFYQSFVDTYEPNDLRKKYTVVDYMNGKKLDFNYLNKGMRVPLPADDPLIAVADPKNNSGADEIYMRLADTYLVVAEAENELNGPTETALDAINAVRERAGLDGFEDLTQEELRQAVRDERGKELAGEIIGRKQDLIRWGILVETVKNLPAREAMAQMNNPLLTEQYKTKAMFEATNAADRIEEKHIFFPIPSNEIALDSALTQNPVWQ